MMRLSANFYRQPVKAPADLRGGSTENGSRCNTRNIVKTSTTQNSREPSPRGSGTKGDSAMKMTIEVLPRNTGRGSESPTIGKKTGRRSQFRVPKQKKPRLYKSIEMPIRLYISTMDVVDVTDPACRKWMRMKAKRRAM